MPTTAFICAGIILTSLCFVPASHSQAPSASTPNATLLLVLGALKTQGDQIAANQTKIETQTAALKEELRQAKIYASRSGSGHR